MPPADELVPELYQLVGAALRDVAQARFMSDVFSRQISFVYEGDGVLRRFPVPRVDIDEAEITLHFAIKEVGVDPARHSSRNAAIGALFDKYSTRIVREAMQKTREAARKAVTASTEPNAADSMAEFEKRFLSDENRELIAGRLLQFFNESVDTLIGSDCELKQDLVLKHLLEDHSMAVLRSEIPQLQQRFPSGPWAPLEQDIRKVFDKEVGELKAAVEALNGRYPDFRLTIDPSAAAIAASGAPVSSIKIKSTVRNYKWAKVDVDETDLRNIRTLNQE